jgi:glycosyltransferase involved in cell wall biosynthesis
MLKISFIIPVYNCEDKIEKCINSIVNQNLPSNNYEIIIINDGSTDSSLSVIERLKKGSDNISVFSTVNKGAGAARNFGLKCSRGDIVTFVDADDYLEAGIVNGLVEEFERFELDILGFETRSVRGKRILITRSLKNGYGKVFKGESFILQYNDGFGPCAKLYRRELFFKNQLFFMEGVVPEDIELVPKLFICARRIMFREVVGYNYVLNPNSITKRDTRSLKVDRIRGLLIVILSLNSFSQKYDTANPLVYNYLKKQLIPDIVHELFYFVLYRTHIDNDLVSYIFRNLKNAEIIPLEIVKGSRHSSFLINKPALFRLIYFFRFTQGFYVSKKLFFRIVRSLTEAKSLH